MRVFLAAAIVVASISIASGAGPVLAFIHGNDVLTNCKDHGAPCVSYVIGLADELEMVAPRLTNICRPEEVTELQLVDVLLAWLDQHPAERHRPAAALAGLAFAEAWPCTK